MTNSANPAGRKQSLKNVRLRKHSDYQRAYAAGHKRLSVSFSWFMAARPQAESQSSRIGLTAGKVLGKAHERNRIKRRMREVLRRHIDLIPPGIDLIFHPRRSVRTIEFTKLDAEVVRILTQAAAEARRSRPHADRAEP